MNGVSRVDRRLCRWLRGRVRGRGKEGMKRRSKRVNKVIGIRIKVQRMSWIYRMLFKISEISKIYR